MAIDKKIDFGKRLGFGGLRLPILNNDQMDIDYETLDAMIDKFMANGFNYFDTSYIYHGQLSEVALGKSLVARYPRDSFLLSTKMPIKFMTQKEHMEEIFEEQLQKCQVDYFDFYLVHAISQETYDICKKWDTFEFLLKKQEEGKFREFGVSVHDTPEFLEMLLTEHPEISFVVLQLNYTTGKIRASALGNL